MNKTIVATEVTRRRMPNIPAPGTVTGWADRMGPRGWLSLVAIIYLVGSGCVRVDDPLVGPGEAGVTTIALRPLAPIIGIGSSVTFSATAQFEDGTSRDVTADAAWVSADQTVATVSNNVATGVLPGQAGITATFEGVEGGTTLMVEPPVGGGGGFEALVIGGNLELAATVLADASGLQAGEVIDVGATLKGGLARDGRLWLATTQGFTSYNPESDGSLTETASTDVDLSGMTRPAYSATANLVVMLDAFSPGAARQFRPEADGSVTELETLAMGVTGAPGNPVILHGPNRFALVAHYGYTAAYLEGDADSDGVTWDSDPTTFSDLSGLPYLFGGDGSAGLGVAVGNTGAIGFTFDDTEVVTDSDQSGSSVGLLVDGVVVKGGNCVATVPQSGRLMQIYRTTGTTGLESAGTVELPGTDFIDRITASEEFPNRIYANGPTPGGGLGVQAFEHDDDCNFSAVGSMVEIDNGPIGFFGATVLYRY